MSNHLSETSILFVDDDPSMRRLFVRSLKRMGFDVQAASSGYEALQMAESGNYPVVITDLRMPGMDGMTLIKRLQATKPDTIFMIMTGMPEMELPHARIRSHGVRLVLTKTGDLKEMTEKIARESAPRTARRHWPSVPCC